MTPEEQKAADEKAAAEAVAGQTKPSVSPEANEENEALDPEGVPYKNRYAEESRKREQAEETIEELTLRMNNLESKISQPPAAVPVSQPDPATISKTDMDEMIRVGPEAYNKKIAEQVQKEFQRKQNLVGAETLIREKYGSARTQFGVSKVLDYAQKNMIDIATDPIRAVKKILKEMDAPKIQPSAEDRKKTAEAIKNKPEGGTRPPAPPVNRNSELMQKVYERGTVDDVAAALAERWKTNKSGT